MCMEADEFARLLAAGGRRGRSHQPGQADFRMICRKTSTGNPFPAFLQKLDSPAVLVGDPAQAGPYLIRVRVPSGVKLMPHRHPDTVYTVMSGVFYIGLGDQFDGDRLNAYPPGSVIILPGDTAHFHWAKSGEYVTQVTAIGPLGLEYMDANDDPRSKAR